MVSTNKNKLYLIMAILLLVALYEMPNGYYAMLRIIVSVVSGKIIYDNYQSDTKPFITYIFASVLILFNPVIPIYLTREIWAYIDIATAIIFAAYYLSLFCRR